MDDQVIVCQSRQWFADRQNDLCFDALKTREPDTEVVNFKIKV